jgi:dTDP-4-dehydrorhamnose reductase
MNIFLVGAGGYIGQRLMLLGKKENAIIPCYRTREARSGAHLILDLEHPDNFEYAQVGRGDCVIVAAAISSPDVCVSKREYAWKINVEGTSRFIKGVLKQGARVIFFSSDTVYGEREEPVDESAACHPFGEYGMMKREIEKCFGSEKDFKTLRLSYVFSYNDRFTQYLVDCARKNTGAQVFPFLSRAVVHRDDVVNAVLAVAHRWDSIPHRTINVGGQMLLTRTQLAERVKDIALFGLNIRIEEPPAHFFERRPRTVNMRSPLLPSILGRPAGNIDEAIRVEFRRGNVP